MHRYSYLLVSYSLPMQKFVKWISEYSRKIQKGQNVLRMLFFQCSYTIQFFVYLLHELTEMHTKKIRIENKWCVLYLGYVLLRLTKSTKLCKPDFFCFFFLFFLFVTLRSISGMARTIFFDRYFSLLSFSSRPKFVWKCQKYQWCTIEARFLVDAFRPKNFYYRMKMICESWSRIFSC